MTYVGAEYSVQELFKEIKDRVQTEHVDTFEAYRDLIDETVEEKKGYGFFVDEEDIEQIKRDLELRWGEINPKF